MTVLAWSGELLLLEARWTDKDAHTAKFRLVNPNETRPNPFKQFTKRRSGKAGTRFVMSLAHIGALTTEGTAYDGEVMLAGWADTSTQGYTVTFWLEPPEEGTHQLEGFERGVSSFMCALVELDDDDHPINQTKRDRIEEVSGITPEIRGDTGRVAQQVEHSVEDGGVAGSTPAPATKAPRKLSQYAAMLCNNPDFWEWLTFAHVNPDSLPVTTADHAARVMRELLGIESRREVDEMGSLHAQNYQDMIRRPFVAWSEEREHS